MEVLGKPSINPILFYTGKCSGYVCWVILLLALFNIDIFGAIDLKYNKPITVFFMFVGLVISVWSTFNLGNSTRLGLPTSDTTLKLNGLYKYTRNPIYVGFGFITLASIIYFLNPFVVMMGICNILIYHVIVLNEEKFLIKRFGQDYLDYQQKVRRYL